MDAGFGLGRLHHVFRRSDRARIIRSALDAGFTHFDVAPVYGDGLAEIELGRALRGRSGGVTITTKFGIPYRAIGRLPTPVYLACRTVERVTRLPLGARYDRRDYAPAVLRRSLEGSLRRLGIERVDFLLIHEPPTVGAYAALGPTWDELRRLKDAGSIGAFGVSGVSETMLEAEWLGHVPADSVRMLSMTDEVCRLPAAWFRGRKVFVYNLVKHLSRSMGPGRIETRRLIEAFAGALPGATAILASNQPEEIARMGRCVRECGRVGAGT